MNPPIAYGMSQIYNNRQNLNLDLFYIFTEEMEIIKVGAN